MSQKILRIITSTNGDTSFSNQLSNAVIEKLTAGNPETEVKTLDLTKTPLPYLTNSHISAVYAPEETHTPEQKEALKYSNEAIKTLLESDVIVIGVPLYNFGIPAVLKGWIDQIARAGKTFSYSAEGPKGLVTDKKVYLSIASGAIFSEGPYKSYDFSESYLRAVFGFLGMTDVTTFRVEGTAIPDFAENALPKALSSVEEFAF
ncbi:FMN-dependent NADH-azoreductase [Flavobacterium johnsoniae]|uniref:FMN dependent NADH:quinone oxidoreductase n=1 Tax=Flavobacterium johnsoniae (strain ATCC 17061 / DSM 2064 / JCM 8514 / BCRC 14874 / CCUG 350202 / NBRC 14942 / NCIMB 11054 / UW101) TaxID=376686 RepID=A5FEN4_FLAJ1|nr:NAD(P)H-dependent oxidoreductase [Flavobacterium johnsoniae]ABQ06338.1 NAD(P)H dehydrogenase (quinone) [Flavobacterium johnsoniae UW101]OXE95340.1 FMN-dependent NADH-azoreductase [Flavobacterium johnsoniae UW101]WQG82085.1 NAD(P)H-dependent oxidoreductase [Flavobacterium johnsoniae UW101]SHK72321.1 FMN-dependent NADH-azoreductase [Flavobacterium johnsoniae]